MTKRDWAIVEADRLLDHIKGAPDPIQFNVDLIATALRKAKADGIREAADALMRAQSAYDNAGVFVPFDSIVSHFRYYANQIEGGQ